MIACIFGEEVYDNAFYTPDNDYCMYPVTGSIPGICR
jgi:hypothetical protein